MAEIWLCTIFGEQVFGTVAEDRKNLVNQYSDQKAKY